MLIWQSIKLLQGRLGGSVASTHAVTCNNFIIYSISILTDSDSRTVPMKWQLLSVIVQFAGNNLIYVKSDNMERWACLDENYFRSANCWCCEEACATGYCFHMGQSLLAACLWQKLSFLVLQLISGCVDTNMIIMWRSISLVLLFFISSSNAGKSLNYMSSSV